MFSTVDSGLSVTLFNDVVLTTMVILYRKDAIIGRFESAWKIV